VAYVDFLTFSLKYFRQNLVLNGTDRFYFSGKLRTLVLEKTKMNVYSGIQITILVLAKTKLNIFWYTDNDISIQLNYMYKCNYRFHPQSTSIFELGEYDS